MKPLIRWIQGWKASRSAKFEHVCQHGNFVQPPVRELRSHTIEGQQRAAESGSKTVSVSNACYSALQGKQARISLIHKHRAPGAVVSCCGVSLTLAVATGRSLLYGYTPLSPASAWHQAPSPATFGPVEEVCKDLARAGSTLRDTSTARNALERWRHVLALRGTLARPLLQLARVIEVHQPTQMSHLDISGCHVPTTALGMW